MGKNAIIGISECWLTPNDKMFSRSVASKTHKRFRCDRSSSNCEKKGGGVILFVPLKLAPSERNDLNLFNNSTFKLLWVECRCNFSKNCKSKILLNITYNPLKKYQIDFHALVMSHLDYSLLFFFKITSSILLSLEKQMNWASKSVFFHSNIKSSYELRKHKGIISKRHLIMSKSPIYLSQYINN